jgi:hypothetical protein
VTVSTSVSEVTLHSKEINVLSASYKADDGTEHPAVEIAYNFTLKTVFGSLMVFINMFVDVCPVVRFALVLRTLFQWDLECYPSNSKASSTAIWLGFTSETSFFIVADDI